MTALLLLCTPTGEPYQEYVVIHEDDGGPPEDFILPGFVLMENVDLGLVDVSSFPTDRALK